MPSLRSPRVEFAIEPMATRSDFRGLHLYGATSKPRTEMFDGREHLVVPVVPLMEGVIHAVNAPSAEYVPARILQMMPPQVWDGRPLVIGHPTQNGIQISANDPKVLERQGFGFTATSRVNGTRLGTEAWVDVAKLTKLNATRLLERLRAGDPIEVSVGVFAMTNDKQGTFNGKAYRGEWAAVVPDHIAFLPDGIGACSLEMGCGANRMAHMVTAEGVEVIMEKSIIDPVTFKCLRDIPQSERDKMSKADFGDPDNEAFPIKTQADIDAAKHLIGKAGPKVKARIIAIAKRKGLTIPDAWKSKAAQGLAPRSLKERILALFDTPEQMASEEAAELVAYNSMRTLLDGVGAQWDEASSLVDDLIADEEENPTTTPGQEDAEEEVEDARLDAIRMLCYSMMSTLQNVVSVTYDQQTPEPMPADSPRYMESIRAAVGKAISAKNMKVIQSTHDASHTMHDQTMALGADCSSEGGALKAASAAHPCGCGNPAAAQGESDMTQEERIKAILAHPHTIVKNPETLKNASDAILKTCEDAAEQRKKEAESLTSLTSEVAALKAAAAAPMTDEQFLKVAPPSIVSIVSAHKASEVAQRTELVGKLKTAAAGVYTEEQLNAMPLDQLVKVAQLAKVDAPVVDFSGRGIPGAPGLTPKGDTSSYAPPDPYAAGVKTLQSAQK